MGREARVPKRWDIVPATATARLGISSGEGGGAGSRGFKIRICLDKEDCVTLPWEWATRREARDAIEGHRDAWRTAEIVEK